MNGRNSTPHPPRVPRRLTLEVYVRYEGDTIFARPQPLGERHLLCGGDIELFLVSNRDHRIKDRQTVRCIDGTPLPEVAFHIPERSFSAFSIAADVVDRHGHRFSAQVILESAGEEPEWFGSQEAVSLDVPAPWTPLECHRRRSGLRVTCWGREYDFATGSLLHATRSHGRPLLLGPVRVAARVDGNEVSWKRGRTSALSTYPDQVAFVTQVFSDSGLRLKARTEVDFDGMVRVDWRLEADCPLRLERLSVDLRLPEDVARYFYYTPREEGGQERRNAGHLTRRTERLGFKNYVWLGDEEEGFSWFTDKDEDWIVGAEEKPINIIKENREVVLRVRLVTRPVQLVPGNRRELEATEIGAVRWPATSIGSARDRLAYSFGFQATPVKPVTEDAWDYRMFCIQQTVEGTAPRLKVSDELLDRLARYGVRSVTLFEHWADAEGYVSTPHESELKDIIERCHTRGLAVLLYFGFLASDLAPEWGRFGKDSIALPKKGYPIFMYEPQPAQAAWVVCLNSPWQDLLIHGMARALDRYNVDGVYLDGTEAVWPCGNTEHGCGSLRPGGAIAPSYPIFGVRTAMRRIYEAVRSRRPEGQVFVHNSRVMTMPTLGWATTAWDGEQFQGVGDDTNVAELLPLDFFRAEFVGRQWGVATEFLLAGAAYTYEEVCGLALLHDVPVKPMTLEQLELMSAIWQVMDGFDRKAARWQAYWEEGTGMTAGPRGVHTSYYHHSENGLLVVLASLCTEEVEAVLKADLRRFGMADAQARDALTGHLLPLSKGKLSIRLPRFGWKLIRVQAA